MFITAKKLLILGAVGALSFGVASHNLFDTKAKAADTANISKNETSQTAAATQTSATFQSNLQAKLNQIITANDDIDTAVSVIDLDSDQQYDAGETTVFKAASTAKLVAIVTYLHEVDEGKASLSQNVNGVSAQALIQRMLEVSDNNAWAALNNYLGSYQQTYAASIGLTSFTGDDYNTITAHDEAKLLSMLYQGKLISASDVSLMYSYMKVADGASLIKTAVPTSATVYHKYGELSDFDGDDILNDTAIVTYEGHHFALVIYTSSPVGSNTAQTDLIHQLTQAVVASLTD